MLKIGEFSHLARVTIKTLRFYASSGLFQPAYVDPRTGYRLYRVEQLADLQHIRLLRELGCSVADIRKLRSLPVESSEYAERIATIRRRLIVRIAQDERRLSQLDALLSVPHRPEPGSSGSMVEEHRIAPVSVLALRDRVRSLGRSVESMFEATEQRASLYDCRAPLSPFLLFHDMEYRESHVDVEVCVPIAPDSVQACGGRIVAGSDRSACLRYSGSYSQTPPLFERLLDWVDRTGGRIAGPLRERYLVFGANQEGYSLAPEVLARSEADLRTELLIPLAGN